MKSFFLFIISLIFILFCPVFVLAGESTEQVMSDSWLNAAMSNIEKKEYEPSLQELDYKGESFANPKFHFANRANNLRAYFDENGMELIPRVVSDEEKWNLKIQSIEVTSGEEEKIFGDLDVAIDGENITCTGDGIEIVYSNSESGIRQSISIQGEIKTERIDFNIKAENLNVSPEGERFVLKSEVQEIVWQIAGIKDAKGEEIAYSLSGSEAELSISLNGHYPINITANIFAVNLSASQFAENAGVFNPVKVRGLSDTADWTAESDETIGSGTKVRITDKKSITLVVKPVR